MITAIRYAGQNFERADSYYGISTDEEDTWPTENVPNGSSLYMMDSKELYLFDEQNQKWLPQQ